MSGSNDSQLTSKIDNEPNEISYIILPIEKYCDEASAFGVLSMLASAINVRLTLDGNQYFPNIHFDKFNSLLNEDKIFLFGPSGCGKSRTIYEIIKENVRSFDKIHVINPRTSFGERSRRAPLRDFISTVNSDDAIVWDNFPDDLFRRDIANTRIVLEILSSCDARMIMVALKPKYLEVFREIPSNMPEFFNYGVRYNQDQFKRIVEQYGTTIPQFNEVYRRYISPNLESIAVILWNKEPTPLTIFDYYDQLKKKEQIKSSSSIDGVNEAESLLRSTNYYERQFELVRGSEQGVDSAEFLYVLKMCYELGLDRTWRTISGLQQAIFGSVPPNEVYKKLSNWIYVYGQQYSMHDVCRDAVILTDDVKMRILSYISVNFSPFITDDPKRVNLLGLFIGRHIQFVLQNTSMAASFLPDNIYNFMKINAGFEKAIGHGVGEVFQSLHDNDRKRLLKKADTELEFGVGVAESLGHKFPLLDNEQRKPLLNKIYDGYLFARFFGQSLGQHFKDLSPHIKCEILDHAEINPQFADGLGIGIGQIFESLDEELKKKVNQIAEANIGLTRGLGFGLGFNFRSLSENQRQKVYGTAEKNFQRDMGLGLGIASQYVALSKDLQDEIIRRCKDNYAFGFGFGLYLGYITADRCPDDVLGYSESNSQLSYGLGYGFGIKFPYEPVEFRSSLISKSNENNQLDRGLGYGVGLIIRHLSKNLQTEFFKQGNLRNEFDRGLGCGIGFSWKYQSQNNKDESYKRCKTNSSFAQGLGFGQGYHFKYLSREEIDNIFKSSDGNNQYDNGLGYGLGWSFPYIGNVLRAEVLERSETNNLFAYGLASGLGVILSYLPSQTQNEIFQRATKDGWFGRGLGFGLGGYALQSYTEKVREEVFLRLNDKEFAIGLGEGIGFAFKFFDHEFQQKILNSFMGVNPFYTKGLGIGFGKNFKYLSHDFQLCLYDLAARDTHFALGLGEGIGNIFQYLDDSLRSDILTKALLKEDGFAKGLGTGFGNIFNYFPKEFCDVLLLRHSAANRQFAIGLGNGLGFIFAYLPSELQSTLLERAERNTHFALGLGKGIGSIFFRYSNITFEKNTIAKLEDNPFLAKGFGMGIGLFYKYYELGDLYSMISASISSNPNVAEGFGTGIGIIYPYITEKLRDDLSQLAKKNVHFASALGFSLGHVFYSPGSKNDSLFYVDRLSQTQEFEYGFGVGVGHNFPYLGTKIQEQVLIKALKTRIFGNGFGAGMAKSFWHLDKITQQEVFKQALNSDKDICYSFSLGYGLGNLFPSTTVQLQKQLLEIVNGHNNLFTKGFAVGVGQILKYLNKQSLDQLSKLARIENLSDKYPGMNEKNSLSNVSFLYDYFVGLDQGKVSTLDEHGLQSWISSKDEKVEEVSFLGKQKRCCVCYIDMIGSTKTASRLDKTQLSKYYSIFLNAMAIIVKNFGGRIVKNAGDALIYYFPDTDTDSSNLSAFGDVLECGITMIAAHRVMNAKMHEEGLPPVNYRISADYGMLAIAKSQSSQSEDLFGSTMNICAKINGKAMPNGMVIGGDMWKIVEQPLAHRYTFKHAGKIPLDLGNGSDYFVYHVESKEGRNILNPFKYRSELNS